MFQQNLLLKHKFLLRNTGMENYLQLIQQEMLRKKNSQLNKIRKEQK